MATRTVSVNASGNITQVPRSWSWSVFAALNQVRTLTDELKTDRTAMKTAADAVETLIEELHDDGGTRKTWEDEVDSDLDVINNYLASIGEQDGVIGGDYAIAEAADPDMQGTGSIVYRIGGEVYFSDTLQALIAPDDPGATEVTTTNWGAWRVVIDRLGVVTTEGPNTAGQTTEEKALLHLGAVAQAANTVEIACFTVHATGGYTPGADNISAETTSNVYYLRQPKNSASALFAAQGTALVAGDGLATVAVGVTSPKANGMRKATIAADATLALTDADTVTTTEAGGWILLTDLAGTGYVTLSSDGVPGVTALTDTDAAGALTALNLLASRLPSVFVPVAHVIVVTSNAATFTAKSTFWNATDVATTVVDESFGAFDRTAAAAAFLSRESNPPAVPATVSAATTAGPAASKPASWPANPGSANMDNFTTREVGTPA